MSEPLRRAALMAVALASIPCTTLRAQRADPDAALRARIATLAARADTLALRWREAKGVADASRGTDHDPIPDALDSVRVGSLLIVTNPSPLPVAGAAPAAAAILDSLFGSALDTLDRHPYYLEALNPDTAAPRTIHPWGVTFTWDVDSATLVRDLVSTIPVPTPDAALREWLTGAGVQPTFHQREELEGAYRNLVTASYAVARDCFRGAFETCTQALSLDPPADRVEHWFRSAEERRRAAEGFTRYFEDAVHQPMFRACGDGADSVCIALLHYVDPSSLPRALGDRDRQLLVRLALVTGGRDAYRRLVADTALPMTQRLSAAAGVPIDTLLARWRAEVLTARPVPVALHPMEEAAGIFWIVVFGFMGSRSSRWRFG